LRAIVEEIGVTDFGINAIVRHHRDIAAPRQCLGYIAIQFLIAALPGATLKENDHRRGHRVARSADIEPVPRALGIGDGLGQLNAENHYRPHGNSASGLNHGAKVSGA